MSAMDSVSENWTVRVALAAAFRLLDKEGLNEGIDNHVSVMAPAASGRGEVMLISPYGVHWSQVTASCLLGYSLDEEKVVEGTGEMFFAGLNIHVPMHKLRPDARCIVHVHAPYSTAIAMPKNFTHMPMTHQNACMFYGKTAIEHSYKGIAENMSEGERMCLAMKDKDVLFLKHHGVMIVGESVASAVYQTYFLERACMFHVLAASGGQEVEEIEEEVVKETFDQALKDYDHYAETFFKAMVSCVQPGFDK